MKKSSFNRSNLRLESLEDRIVPTTWFEWLGDGINQANSTIVYSHIDNEVDPTPNDPTDSWIDILSVDIGLPENTDPNSEIPKDTLRDLQLVKALDRTTPNLYLFTEADNDVKIDLVIRRAGREPTPYLTYELKDVIITSYSTGENNSGDEPQETFSLNFKDVRIDYKPFGRNGQGNNNPGNNNNPDNNDPGDGNSDDNNSGDNNTGDNNSGDNNSGDSGDGNSNSGAPATTLPPEVENNLTEEQKQEHQDAVDAYNQAQENLKDAQDKANQANQKLQIDCDDLDDLKKAAEDARAEADAAQDAVDDAQDALDDINDKIADAEREYRNAQSDASNLIKSGLIGRWIRQYGPNSHEVAQARSALQQQLDRMRNARRELGNLNRQKTAAERALNNAKADAKTKEDAAKQAEKEYQDALERCKHCKDMADAANAALVQAQQDAQQAAQNLNNANQAAQDQAINNQREALENDLQQAKDDLNAIQQQIEDKIQAIQRLREQIAHKGKVYDVAMQILELIGELNRQNVTQEEQGLIAQWLGFMAGAVGGDFAPPGFGEALGGVQAAYGIYSIALSLMTPWHAGYRGDDNLIDWLVRTNNAENEAEAREIIAAMWDLYQNGPFERFQEIKDRCQAHLDECIKELEGLIQKEQTLQEQVNQAQQALDQFNSQNR